MADMFQTKDVLTLLNKKRILFIGDSNTRAAYKDLVSLINKNTLTNFVQLRKRGEDSFEGDRRIKFSGLSRGRQYVEAREFSKHDIHITFYFVTRCYNKEMEEILNNIKENKVKPPDVLVMNSCIWDISRWGPNGVDDFKVNMCKLMVLVQSSIPKTTLFVWVTTLPVATSLRGGLLVKQIDFLQTILRFEIMEANLFCRNLVEGYGYDILDAHYHLRNQVHRRLKDGIHYDPVSMRFLTNLLLTHIALSWDKKLPGNYECELLDRIKNLEKKAPNIDKVKLPDTSDAAIVKEEVKTPRKKKNIKRALKKPDPWNNGASNLIQYDLRSIAETVTSKLLSAANSVNLDLNEPFWKDTASTYNDTRPTSSNLNNYNSLNRFNNRYEPNYGVERGYGNNMWENNQELGYGSIDERYNARMNMRQEWKRGSYQWGGQFSHEPLGYQNNHNMDRGGPVRRLDRYSHRTHPY